MYQRHRTPERHIYANDINDTSHLPLLSLYIPITHLYFFIYPLPLYNGNYTCTLHPPPNAQIRYRLLSTGNQSINGFDVLLYAICTCNEKTSQPSILLSNRNMHPRNITGSLFFRSGLVI